MNNSCWNRSLNRSSLWGHHDEFMGYHYEVIIMTSSLWLLVILNVLSTSWRWILMDLANKNTGLRLFFWCRFMHTHKKNPRYSFIAHPTYWQVSPCYRTPAGQVFWTTLILFSLFFFFFNVIKRCWIFWVFSRFLSFLLCHKDSQTEVKQKFNIGSWSRSENVKCCDVEIDGVECLVRSLMP